uniref:P-loop ATPase, Sll1717 family n=1 Tax=unclassified Mycolicibacterium TaxID=2636767 RepID=UPI0024E0E9AC|nr:MULTISPECIES: hypothetical protein [unclassified Mycolicibacterium]
MLLIDCLDSIFLNDTKYNESLYSLVQAAYGLNQKLKEHVATGSIVLLLRNDVFARISLSLPDSQKMRDDLSFDLDWRVMSGQAGVRAPLLQLANRKAGQALGLPAVDVLSYFPSHINLGGRGGPVRRMQTFRYLMLLTRHTPRDPLRLFDEIRKVEASGIYPESAGKLSDQVILEGVLQYSMKYFVGAIRNEFAGYKGGPESAEIAISALKSIGKQTFDRNEFAVAVSEVADADVGKREPDRLLTLLFYAGAIGNIVMGGHETYMQFYHRRDEAEIYLKGQFALHNALIHAWGINRGH